MMTMQIIKSFTHLTHHMGQLEAVAEPECVVLTTSMSYVGYILIIQAVKWIRYQFVLE